MGALATEIATRGPESTRRTCFASTATRLRSPPPTARPETIAAALERIQSYKHGGFPELLRAIADYNGVEPENVVLGAGADDILMLCARAYAGPGDRVAIADEPSYPLYRVAAWVTGADVGDDSPVLTFVCRPHNPSGAMVDIPAARPLVVDEAYFEYGGQTAMPLHRRRRDRRQDVLEGVRPRVGARSATASRRRRSPPS